MKKILIVCSIFSLLLVVLLILAFFDGKRRNESTKLSNLLVSSSTTPNQPESNTPWPTLSVTKPIFTTKDDLKTVTCRVSETVKFSYPSAWQDSYHENLCYSLNLAPDSLKEKQDINNKQYNTNLINIIINSDAGPNFESAEIIKSETIQTQSGKWEIDFIRFSDNSLGEQAMLTSGSKKMLNYTMLITSYYSETNKKQFEQVTKGIIDSVYLP